MLLTSVDFYSDSLPCHQFLLLQLLLWNLRSKLNVNDHNRSDARAWTEQSCCSGLTVCFHGSSKGVLSGHQCNICGASVFRQTQKTETPVCLNTAPNSSLLPFSSERSPPLVWGQSAPSRSGSSRCGTESSCRGWCGRGRDTCVSSSWGPCWPGCVRSPESPHPDPEIQIIQKGWWEPEQIQRVSLSSASSFLIYKPQQNYQNKKCVAVPSAQRCSRRF